jgi:hypothetical protein
LVAPKIVRPFVNAFDGEDLCSGLPDEDVKAHLFRSVE